MALSLEQQDRLIRLRWPFKTIALGADFGLWRGRLVGLSAPYDVNVLYVRRHFQDGFEYAHPYFPQVTVSAPRITRRPEAPDVPIPHVYDESRRPSLCLFDPAEQGWTSDQPIAMTTLPWAADWLRFYEAWQATGVWAGGGRDHGLPLMANDPGPTRPAFAAARATQLIGTDSARALLANASMGDGTPLPRWRWADVPCAAWSARVIDRRDGHGARARS